MARPEKPTTKENQPADPNISLMERELDMTKVRQLERKNFRGETWSRYEAHIDGQPYRLTFIERKNDVEVLAERISDSVSFSWKVERKASAEPLKAALRDVNRQVISRHQKEKAQAEFEKAQALITRRSPPGEAARQFFESREFAQAMVIVLSGLTGGATFGGSGEEGPQRKSPAQEFNAKIANRRADAEKEAREKTADAQFTLGLRRNAEWQTSWSWEHLAAAPAVNDEVVKTLENQGFKGVTVSYTAEAQKLYHCNHENRKVTFAVLPGGGIKYEVQTFVANATEPELGYAINVIDSRSGNFSAETLESAVAKLKEEIRKPLDTSRVFLFSSYPGLRPLEVTGNPMLASYALPYPVLTNIPTRDYRIPLPLGADQVRNFLYTPTRAGVPIPVMQLDQWYHLGQIWEEKRRASRK